MVALAAACAMLPSTDEGKLLLSRTASANNKKDANNWMGAGLNSLDALASLLYLSWHYHPTLPLHQVCTIFALTLLPPLR
jgi:hypothetical protein